jgi:hypothetical protein
MARHRLHALAFGLTITVGGCAGIPALDVDGPLTVDAIVDEIHCEVLAAAGKYPRLKKQNWVASIDLSLQVDDSAGLTPTVSFIDPLATAGTSFTFGASAELKGSRKRIYEELLDLPIHDLKPRLCPAQGSTYNFTGDLGIVDAVDIGLRSVEPEDAAQYQKDKAFGQTIEFVITKNVSGVGPTWTLVRFTGPGGLFGAERVDTHTLAVSFASGATATKAGIVAAPLAAQTKANQLNNNMLLRSVLPGRVVR